MLVRELKHRKRDNVNKIISKKQFIAFKQLKEEKNAIKVKIDNLLKEEVINFNLQEFLNEAEVSPRTQKHILDKVAKKMSKAEDSSQQLQSNKSDAPMDQKSSSLQLHQ